MEKTNNEEVAICADCANCLIESVPDAPCLDYTCKKHTFINCVTGVVTCEDCSDINKDGHCEDFVRKHLATKRSLLKRILRAG